MNSFFETVESPKEKIFQISGLSADFYQLANAHPITSDTLALYTVGAGFSPPVTSLMSTTKPTILDLGCGCGALLLNIAKDYQLCHFIGVDIVPELIDLAQKNFDILSDLYRYNFSRSFFVADYAQPIKELPEHSVDLILANPPFYPKNSGRKSPHSIKALGRMESTATMSDLLVCIKRYLANSGTALVIYPATRADEFAQNCTQTKLKIVHQLSCDTTTPPLPDRIIFEIAHASD